MNKIIFRYIRVYLCIILAAAAVLYGYGEPYADVFVIPCSYRVELTVRNLTADSISTEFARVGSHYVGSDILYFRTWAEFDISVLDGETVTGAGFKIFNEWAGTRITSLRYTPVQPSSANQYQLLAQHNRSQNMYANFSWTVNANGAWTPADETFYSPDWKNYKRIYDNKNTLVNDLQAHIDDPAKGWFAVEFSYNGSDRSNFRFPPPDEYDSASVVLAVATGGEFLDEKNFGMGEGTCETLPSGGKPINFSTGNEHHTDYDFILPGPGLPLSYVRHYNSRSQRSGCNGYGWTGSYSEHLTAETGRIILRGADGGDVHFTDDGQGKYISEADTARVIMPVSGGHALTEPDGRVLTFDGAGILTQIRDRNGNTQTAGYSDGKLSCIEDNYGHRLDFAYDGNGFLETLTAPAGVFSYTYDAQGNLTGVTNPDNTAKTYLYSDSRDPHNLTGIIYENGVRYSIEYDSWDRAVLSGFSDGMERITVEYHNGMTRRVTDSLGRETVFELQASKGIGRVKSAAGAGCGSCLTPSGGNYTLNSRLGIEQKEDAEGNITAQISDDRGNILTKTEASGTPQERAVTFTWHPQYSFVTSVTRESIANPGQNAATSFTYDTTGNLREKTDTGYSGAAPVIRTTFFSYNSSGQITGIDGPRTDVTDTLTFEYYPNDTGQGLNRGMLKKIKDGAGHETLFEQYNAWGKPCQVSDADGVITVFVYDAMGRMTSKSSAGLTASYDYDSAGNLTAVHLPGPRDIVYTYTSANLLEKIQDNEGNYIKYSYDAEGNRTNDEIYDKNSVLRQFTDYEPDDYSRLKKIIYPGGVYEEFSYNGNSSLTQVRDAKGEITAYSYDALNRLTGVIQPGNRIIIYGYDTHDNLKTVTDAKNNVTSYTYDDFGREISVSSPDSGTAVYRYDAADNAVSKTDANGITVTYQYDALNRLTAVQFPDPSQNITFGYDSGQYGKRKLTSISDPAGTAAYAYNNRGQLTRETRVADGVTYVTQYLYDSITGERSGMIYPGGLTLVYRRDANGQISGITADGQDVTKTVTYMPFGPVNSLAFGNNILTLSKEYDSRYFPTRIQAGSLLDYQYTYDSNGNVLTVSGMNRAPLSPETTDYSHTGNRLTQSSGSEAKTYSYDNNGNIISDGKLTFVYNQNNRLVRVTEGATVLGEYFYDAFGRRVKKVISGIPIVYHYDTAGNLIAETTADGMPSRDIVYLKGARVAMKLYGSQAEWYYFINDNIGTPQKIVNEAGEVVWAGFYQPFGKAWAYPAAVTNNFRFPGQYYDAETGLHYNWNRYYDPDTGRYLMPDPIGLEGGINLYSYVLNNPINRFDFFGLQSQGDFDEEGKSIGIEADPFVDLSLLFGAIGMIKNMGVTAGTKVCSLTTKKIALTLKKILRKKAGFGDEGIIIDNSIGTNPQRLAEALRLRGINARSVNEIFGNDPGSDVPIRQLAKQLGGRVLASDRGRDLTGGFFEQGIKVPQNIKNTETFERLIKEAIKK